MPKYVVRYGAMRFLGIMTTRGEETFPRGTQVIARTDRGLECSVVLCEALLAWVKVRLAGLKLHVTPLGRPVHENCNVPA